VSDQYAIARIDEWPYYGFFYPDNVYGVQFHPEPSNGAGKFLVKLQRFLFDHNVYQEFSAKTLSKHGRRYLIILLTNANSYSIILLYLLNLSVVYN